MRTTKQLLSLHLLTLGMNENTGGIITNINTVYDKCLFSSVTSNH